MSFQLRRVVQTEGIVDRVPGFMPKDSHTFAFAGAFNLQHLRSLELHQPRMRQIEGNSKTRDAIRREPFFTEPDMRSEVERTRIQLPIKLLNTKF